MNRSEYLDLAERLLRHVEQGTTDSAAQIRRIPVAEYLDPARWQMERERIFKRLPLLLAFTCEMRNPGDYRAMEVVDIPVLIVRGRDGVARAFMNVCSHRGAALAQESAGNCRRFTCMNHGWTYDDQGRLVGLSDKAKFGEIDQGTHGLKQLPCAERAGLIFVSLTPGAPLDLETYLGGMLPELESLGLEHWHMYRQCRFDSPNWKVAHDGYMETYHLAIMHAKTIGPTSIGNITAYDAYGPLPSGPHQRLGIPRQSIVSLRKKPQESWRTEQGLDCVRPVFPNSIFAVRGDGGLISQIFPGPTPDSSVTVQHHLYPDLPETPEAAAERDARVELFLHTVRDEDTKYAFQTQRGLASGAIAEFIFGKNEVGLHRWHDSVRHYLNAT